jgi:Trk K+ transport system NAD-binding subunit
MIAIVGLVTIGISAYMILYNHELYDASRRVGLLKIFGAGQEPEKHEKGELRGHVIVVGLNPMGRYIVERLVERGETVVAIDTDARKLEGLPCMTIQGDAVYNSVLDEAGLQDAKLLVSALQIENANNLLAYRATQEGVATSIHAFDQSVVRDLKEIGVDFLIDSKFQGTRKMIQELKKRGVLG